MRTLTRFLRWLLIATFALALMIPLSSASAQDRSLNWRRWDSNVVINSDGTLSITEEFEISFIGGPFTYGFRQISMAQLDSIRDVRVSEAGDYYTASSSQSSNTYTTSTQDGDFVITWYYPATSNQTRTFRIEYVVVGAILIDTPGDVLNWQVVGEDHAYPIQSSTVHITMPPGAQVITGDGPASRGASAALSVDNTLGGVSLTAQNVPANSPIEVYVRFTPGVIPANPPRWQAEYVRQAEWDSTYGPLVNLGLGAAAFGILILGLLGIVGLWFTRGRDPKAQEVPSYLTEPPSDLAPGLVGMLIDERADLQDIIATLLDLARRGYVRIVEEQKSVLGIRTGMEYRFERLEEGKSGLSDYEAAVLRGVFGGASSATMDSLQNEFYASIPRITSKMYAEGVSRKLFPTNPENVRRAWAVAGVAGLVLSVGGGFFLGAFVVEWAPAALCIFAALGAISAAVIAASSFMPVKTAAGSLEAAKWRAFREFLRQADRYADLGSLADRFDQYLPYAVAFGFERLWIRRFARVPGTPVPGWYIPHYIGMPHGGMVRGKTMGEGGSISGMPEGVAPPMTLDRMSEGFSGGLERMSDGLVSMLNRAATTFSSTPSSSGSGGFSGSTFSSGGFSGGGFSSGGSGGAGFG